MHPAMNPTLRKSLAILSSFMLALISFTVVSALLGQAQVSLTRITYASNSSRRSELPSISCDGSRIAFESTSDFHNEGLPANYFIWLYDAKTQALTRLTPRNGGRDAFEPSISADGSKIAFWSDSDYLGQGLPDGQFEIWLAITNPLTLTRLTTSAIVFGVYNANPSISADGAKVAFTSNFDFQAGARLNHLEIWLVDISSRQLTRLTHAVPGPRSSSEPHVNADGSKVVFRSNADFFNQGIPGSSGTQIWLYDRAAMTLTRVSYFPFPPITGQTFLYPSISADGARIVFAGSADLLDPGSVRQSLWLSDTAALTYTRVTSSPSVIHSPRISPDGRTIVFAIDTHPISGQLLSGREIWQYDIASMTFTRVTSSTATGGIRRDNIHPSPNGDSTIAAFQSTADFFGQGNVGAYEIWRADITPTLTISPSAPGTNTVFLPLAMRGIGGSTPVVWEDDDFNTLIPGELDGQNGWVRAAPDRASAIVAPSAGGGQLLHIDPAAGATIVMNKEVPDQLDGQHTLHARVLVDALGLGSGCNFSDSLAALDSLAKIEVRTNPSSGYNKKFQLYFGSRTMRINYGPSGYQAVTIVPRTQLGHWYTILVTFDLSTERANVWVDGVLAARDVPVHPGPIVDLGLSGWDLPGSVQLDDLRGMKQ
jgi:Tol biopolymer transport system component